jgi:predicted helicase
LIRRVREFIEAYNSEVDRFRRAGKVPDLDKFVRYDKIAWDRDLKSDLKRGRDAVFDESKIRVALYRPFTTSFLFFDRILNAEIYGFPSIVPTPNERNNISIACSDLAYRSQTFSALAVRGIADLHLCATLDGHECFPFYIYNDDGTNRRENITDWSLAQFRAQYNDESITKWEIFHYVYGILHHPGYRTKFADNLKRELPRIPFAPDFRAFATAGAALAKLHLDYEQLEPWPLRWIETPDVPLSYRVEKLKLSKDKTTLTVNKSLALDDIPPEVFEYRLGNRSALDWVIDQYQVWDDKRSGIKSDPNREDDEQYIVRLIGQVVRVSVETVKFVKALPEAFA